METINILKTILKEHWEYRQQLVKLAKADLIKTYRGAALGWSWAIIKPAVTIFVYWFAELNVPTQMNLCLSNPQPMKIHHPLRNACNSESSFKSISWANLIAI